MFLVELVMQGVRGTRELARLRFQSGFNFVSAGNESGKTTAVDTMQRLLFPNSDPSAMEGLISRHTPDASRGALVVSSDDGTYYRVIQDFSKRGVNLSKYNAASKEFNLLHKDWESTTQFMSGLFSGISEEDYARVFLLRREHLAAPAGPAVHSPAPIVSRPQSSKIAQPVVKNAAAQTRLAELRETLGKAEHAADADYRYQAAKLALEETEKKLAVIDGVDQKKAELEASIAELKGCEGLPDNFPEMLDDYERRQSQKMVDADELSKELDGLTMQHEGIPSVNVATDKWFLIGAAIGVLSIIAGAFVLTAEYAPLFPIGVIVSCIVMAAAWYNGSRKNVQRRAVKNEIDQVQKDLIDLEKKFVHENVSINAYMRAAGVSNAGELKERSENYRYFLSLRNDIEEQQHRALGDMTLEVLQQQYAKQQEEIQELERAAREVASDNIDTYGIRQDIERIESETAPAGTAWDFGGGEQDLPTDFGAPPVMQAGFFSEMNTGGRIGGIEMDTLIPAVEAAAQRNLAAITGGKYVRIEVGHEDEPVVHTKDDARVPYRELSHGTKALVFFCLRTGLVEALAGKRRLPFILDDALAGFDPIRQKAACQILRALGTKTQVVLFTSNPELKAAGDMAAELK